MLNEIFLKPFLIQKALKQNKSKNWVLNFVNYVIYNKLLFTKLIRAGLIKCYYKLMFMYYSICN